MTRQAAGVSEDDCVVCGHWPTVFCALGGRRKMVDRDTLLSSYRSSIMRFQKLLKTHMTEEDHDYIKERLSACRAAVKALIESETVRK